MQWQGLVHHFFRLREENDRLDYQKKTVVEKANRQSMCVARSSNQQEVLKKGRICISFEDAQEVHITPPYILQHEYRRCSTNEVVHFRA